MNSLHRSLASHRLCRLNLSAVQASVTIVLVLLFRDQSEARCKLAYGLFLALIALFLLSGGCLCFPLMSKAG
jgi:heme/copper-type cytochrome/quinol oxidase subunit 4